MEHKIQVACRRITRATTNNETWSFVSRVVAYGECFAVGYMEVEFVVDGSQMLALIDDVNVVEDYQRQGHATALFDALSVWTRTAGLPQSLVCYNANTRAMALYDKLGFSSVPSCEDMALRERHNAPPIGLMQEFKSPASDYPFQHYFEYVT